MKVILLIGASLLIGAVSGQLSSSRNQDCKDNESFNTCGSACEPSCDAPSPSFCTLQCVVGCQCNSGFYRRASDKACVPQSECNAGVPVLPPVLPAPNNTCGANEENNDCHNPCTEKKCPQKNAPLVNCLMACSVGCSCKSGFVRNLKGECVKSADCPAIDTPVDENPCNLADCRTGFKCVPQNGQATCIPVPEDPPTGITCANVRCGNGPCAMVEPVGCPGCKRTPQCLPVNKCDSMKCKNTEECVLVQVTCVRAPCYPVAECRPKKNIKPLVQLREPRQTSTGPSCMTARCGTPGGCALTRPMSCDTRDANGMCPIQVGCVQENPCAATSCLVGTQCVLHEVQCIRAPCPPIAQCEPLNDAPSSGYSRCKGKFEKYAECKTACSDTKCNEEPRFCPAVCTGGGCVCQEGFFRDKRGQCVTQNQCDIQKGK